MNHNYKLTDFKKQREFVEEIDLRDIAVVICLRDVLDIPVALKNRFEDMINNLIDEQEEEKGIIIPVSDIEVEKCIGVNREVKELYIEIYVVYDAKVELLQKKEVVGISDEDYSVIKEFYFKKLNEHIAGQIEKIRECIQ